MGECYIPGIYPGMGEWYTPRVYPGREESYTPRYTRVGKRVIHTWVYHG